MDTLVRVILVGSLLGSAFSLTCRLQDIKDNGGVINPATEMCAHEKFQGPIGRIIATFHPSKISRLTKNNGASLVLNMASMMGLVPVIGSYMTLFFRQFSMLYKESQNAAVNRIVSELQGEVMSLKRYVDAKVQQLEYTQLIQSLVGLLAGAKACTDYDKADQIVDLERCLISLNTRVVGFVGRFLPGNNQITSYDWSLLLFRQYADLQLTVTQDLLRVAMKLKKKLAQEDYARRLYYQSESFSNYSTTSVEKLILVHKTFKSMTCNTGLKWWNPRNPFSSLQGY